MVEQARMTHRACASHLSRNPYYTRGKVSLGHCTHDVRDDVLMLPVIQHVDPLRSCYLTVEHDAFGSQTRIFHYPELRQLALNGCEFGNPSSSTEIDARHTQQLANFGQYTLASHSIDFEIGIFRHFGHGTQRMREKDNLGFHLYYTLLMINHYGQGFSFRLLRCLAEVRRHLDRMHVERESIQSLLVGIRLRHFLKDAPEHVPRNLISPPETQSDGPVPVMYRYAYLITGICVAQ